MQYVLEAVFCCLRRRCTERPLLIRRAVCVDEKTLLGSYSASVELQEDSVRFVMGREMDLERLISHRFPLAMQRGSFKPGRPSPT